MTIEMLQKIPPNNLEAEMSLLGAILMDREAMPRIGDQLRQTDFYKKAHSLIYEVMQELYNNNEPIDVLTVSNRLEEREILEKTGGKTYLVKLSNAVPTTSHLEQYLKIVHRKALLRKLLSTSQEITSLALDESTDDVATLIDQVQQKVYAVGDRHQAKNFTNIRSVLDGAFERIDELHREKGKLRGVTSGFTGLDNLLSGFQPSDLIILAARPSVGKTALALDFARSAAVHSKKAVAMFSLEMSKEQLVDRMLCAQSGVNLWKLRTGNLSDDPGSGDFQKIGEAMGVLSETNIFIDDTPGATVMQIRSKVRRLMSEHDIGLVVIDYLQLMESHNRDNVHNRVQEVAVISRHLKGIARELNVPVLALSQLSRAVENLKPAIPKLAHLRESGSIEQDADVVMFIYRKSADRNYRPEDIPPDERNVGEIHIAKHRNGPTGVVKMFWDGDSASYKNMDNIHSSAPPPPPMATGPKPINAVPKF